MRERKTLGLLWSKIKPDQAFEGSELAAIMYSIKLTYTPDQISLNDINELKEAGLDDGENS